MIIFFTTSFFCIPSVYALSDSKQIVLDAWTLVNEGYYDPEILDEIQWKKIRQKTLQKSIDTTEDAYSAIEEMLKLSKILIQGFLDLRIMNYLSQVT